MRRAVIDLGTNTFNLLVAEIADDRLLKTLYTDREAVQIGMGGINHGLLTPDAIKRAVHAIERFQKCCAQFGVSDIRCIATSAVRGASNANELLTQVKNVLGLEIKIISGEEEARLIYLGSQLLYDFQQEAVIMDIGGGSTEFIKATGDGVQHIVSLNIGVSRLYQRFGSPSHMTESLQQEILQAMDEENKGRLERDFTSSALIGSSGSFETFFEMVTETAFDKTTGLSHLPKEALMKVLDWTIQSSAEDRANHPWIIPIRKAMLPLAALKVKWAMQHLGTNEILVSPYSLKEGALMDSFS